MAEKRPPRKPTEDRVERRVKFYLGVFIISTTFIYIVVSAVSTSTDHPLSLPDWKYIMPFVAVAFIVVYQTDKKDIISIFRIFFGGVAGGVVEALKKEEEEETDGDAE